LTLSDADWIVDELHRWSTPTRKGTILFEVFAFGKYYSWLFVSIIRYLSMLDGNHKKRGRGVVGLTNKVRR
jgi:hypothetical protein